MIGVLALMAFQTAGEPIQWGREALRAMYREYSMPNSPLLAERPDKRQPAFNWGVGVVLSALNAAARLDQSYREPLRSYADASRAYWNDGGYDVLPAPKPRDRYYDDNAWMALALVETYEVLGDRKYLDWAQGALDFALAGEAKAGGVYWRESDRASRNTCSNAPTAAACLAVFRATRDERRKEKAIELYQWTREHLRDPQDGLYWDSLGNDGKIDRTKWSYNTALMIRTAVELGKKTEAQEMAAAAKARWMKDGGIDDSARFAHLLLEALVLAGEPRANFVPVLVRVNRAKTPQGWTPTHWGKLSAQSNPEILDLASFARACFVVGRSDK